MRPLLVIGCLVMAFSGALAVVPVFGLLSPVFAIVACVCVGRGVVAGDRAWLPGLAAFFLFVGAVQTAIATHKVALYQQRAAYSQQRNLAPPPGPTPTYIGVLRTAPHWLIAPSLVIVAAFAGARDPRPWRDYGLQWNILFAIFPLTIALVLLLGRLGAPLTA